MPFAMQAIWLPILQRQPCTGLASLSQQLSPQFSLVQNRPQSEQLVSPVVHYSHASLAHLHSPLQCFAPTTSHHPISFSDPPRPTSSTTMTLLPSAHPSNFTICYLSLLSHPQPHPPVSHSLSLSQSVTPVKP
ncbi:hypothetical protein Mapa_009275 [Marchantia paleacea]|nr:hypothetical protein Mapa_009275 [Marchantia paleacea]